MPELPKNLPLQIISLISNMSDKTQSLHSRTNYRNTLDIIRAEIEKEVKRFDNEPRKK